MLLWVLLMKYMTVTMTASTCFSPCLGEEAVAVENMKERMKKNLDNARGRVDYLRELTLAV